MHRCLSIPELLDSIAEWLQYSDTLEECSDLVDGICLPPSTPTPNALINFASTCRVFYEPSMNVLWHTLLSLKPLVKCFSQDIWQEKDGMVVGQAILSNFTYINSHWSSFLDNHKPTYSKRLGCVSAQCAARPRRIFLYKRRSYQEGS